MNKNIIYVLVVVLALGVLWFGFRNNGTQNITLNENASATSTFESATTTSTSTGTTGNNSNSQTGNPKQVAKDLRGYPNSWPSDVPKYPREVVKYTGGNNPQSGPVEASVVFTTRDSVNTAKNFYLNNLVANGWKITENGNGLANQITLRAVKGGRNVGVYIEKTSTGITSVTVGINLGL